MLKTNDHIDDNGISYWKIFRIIFIVFSLYLLKDVFYRWDGFKYHSTFAEFIPSVALVTIFWSMLATLAAGLIWFLLRGTEYLCRLMKWKIKVEFLLVFAGISLVLIVFALIGKPLVTKAPIPITSKLVVAICILLVSIYLTWNSRNNFYLVYDRITPLVWLFGLWLIISVPIVGYHTWLKQPTIHAPKKTLSLLHRKQNVLI